MQQKPGKTAYLSMGAIEKEHKSNHCKMLTTNLQHFSLFTFYFLHCNQQAKSEFTHQAFFFMTQHAHLISLPPRPCPRILLRLTHHFLSPSIFKASCCENAYFLLLWKKEKGHSKRAFPCRAGALPPASWGTRGTLGQRKQVCRSHWGAGLPAPRAPSHPRSPPAAQSQAPKSARI